MAQIAIFNTPYIAEENHIEKAAKAISEYKELMNKAIDTIDAAAKDGKGVTKTIDMIVKYDIDDEDDDKEGFC